MGNPGEIPDAPQGPKLQGSGGGGKHSHFYLMPLCPTDDSGSDLMGAQETVILLRRLRSGCWSGQTVQVPTAQSKGPPSCLPGDKEPRTQAKQSSSS